MSDVVFPIHPTDIDQLIEYLGRVRAVHGNIPLGTHVPGAKGFLDTVTVSVGAIGLSKGPAKLVSRGGRPCLVIG